MTVLANQNDPLRPPSPPSPTPSLTLATHDINSCPVRSFSLLAVDPATGLITTHTDGLGYTSGDLSGKPLDSVLNPDSAIRLRSDPDLPPDACHSPDGYTLVAGTHKNGTAMWLNVCVHEVVIDTSRAVHLWLVRDVTRLHWLASLSRLSNAAKDRSRGPEHETPAPAPAAPAPPAPTTVVLRLTRYGVIDSAFPATFLGVASHDMVNTPVMACVHHLDVMKLCRGLSDVHKNSYSTFTVRWRVGGVGYEDEGTHRRDEKAKRNTATAQLLSSHAPQPFLFHPPITTSTALTAPPTYEWVHITAMLSSSTNPSSVNDPICIVRTAASLPPDSLAPPFLISERYIQQTALNHYRRPSVPASPFSPSWPVSVITAPVRALWDDLSRALEEGRQYIVEYLVYVVAVVVDALVWMSGVDVKRITAAPTEAAQVKAIEAGDANEHHDPPASPTTSTASGDASDDEDDDNQPTTPPSPATPTALLRYHPSGPAASATLKAVLRHVEARPAVQAALGYLERCGFVEQRAALVPYLERIVDGGCEWLFEGAAAGRSARPAQVEAEGPVVQSAEAVAIEARGQ
ncbi:hypothetical protein BC938DRAFT_482283 [Jimgerdemannia flammicorona]|uniref:Uncharacterized protein n=1 Tax=Jimgerdemannia flammicorona TaxID=994334 RepID=A0A433QEC5_9FUNG|nr:hypothetical protein BC938DRAFT_482283 [Jimgerdemannia flammicorona]